MTEFADMVNTEVFIS